MKIDTYYQRQKCSQMPLVSGNKWCANMRRGFLWDKVSNDSGVLDDGNVVQLNIQISQGSAATEFRCGGRFILPYSAVHLRVQKWKNYWNRSTFANVIVKIKVAPFYGSWWIYWIIKGWDRRPETKQGIEGKIVRFSSGRVRDRVRVRVRDNWSPLWTPDRRSEAINFGAC